VELALLLISSKKTKISQKKITIQGGALIAACVVGPIADKFNPQVLFWVNFFFIFFFMIDCPVCTWSYRYVANTLKPLGGLSLGVCNVE
jgi:hypothetical protein